MDYSSIAGFGNLGGMGGQGQSPFPMFDTSSFDASSYSGPGSAIGTSFQFPTASGGGGGGLGSAGGFGMNLPTLNGIVGGIGALGSLWGGFQQQKLAKKAFKFQKSMSLINLANQVKSYNTALSDRSRSRGVMESQSQAAQDEYIKSNSLSTKS